MSQNERPTFYRQELNKTIWEVPERYQNLSPVGSGAYGSVWYVVFAEYLCGALHNDRTGFAAHRGLSELSKDGSFAQMCVCRVDLLREAQAFAELDLFFFHKSVFFVAYVRVVCGWGLMLFLCTFLLLSV